MTTTETRRRTAAPGEARPGSVAGLCNYPTRSKRSPYLPAGEPCRNTVTYGVPCGAAGHTADYHVPVDTAAASATITDELPELDAGGLDTLAVGEERLTGLLSLVAHGKPAEREMVVLFAPAAVRRKLAARTDLSEWAFAKLAIDVDAETRRAVIKNPAAPEAVKRVARRVDAVNARVA